MDTKTKNQLRNLNNEVETIKNLQNDYLSSSLFLTELKERFQNLSKLEKGNFYDNEFKEITKLINSQVDGLIKPSFELSEINFTINTAVERLNKNRNKLLQ